MAWRSSLRPASKRRNQVNKNARTRVCSEHGSGLYSEAEGTQSKGEVVLAITTGPPKESWIGRIRRFIRKSRPVTESDFNSKSMAIAPDVRASAHEDGLAILNIATGKVFLSNRTGLQVWEGLVSGLSADAITDKISRECDVAVDLVRRHTFAFLFELERRGLIVRKAEYRP